MKRARAAAAFAMLWAALGLLAGPAAAQEAQQVAGFGLPDYLGPLPRTEVHLYERQTPGLGTGLSFAKRGVVATLTLYNLTLDRIPENPNASLFREHWQSCVDETRSQADRGLLQAVRLVASGDSLLVPPDDSSGRVGIRARWARFQVTLAGKPHVRWLWLAAQNNHFIKLQVSYLAVQERRGTAWFDEVIADYRRLLASARPLE